MDEIDLLRAALQVVLFLTGIALTGVLFFWPDKTKCELRHCDDHEKRPASGDYTGLWK